jgi:hypothetical protein
VYDNRAGVISTGGIHNDNAVGIPRMNIIHFFILLCVGVSGTYVPSYSEWLCENAAYEELDHISSVEEAIAPGIIAFIDSQDRNVYMALHPNYTIAQISWEGNCSHLTLDGFRFSYQCNNWAIVQDYSAASDTLFPPLYKLLSSAVSTTTYCTPNPDFIFFESAPNCLVMGGKRFVVDGELTFIYDDVTGIRETFSPIISLRTYYLPGKAMLTVTAEHVFGILTCPSTDPPVTPIVSSGKNFEHPGVSVLVEDFYPCSTNCLIGQSGVSSGTIEIDDLSSVLRYTVAEIRYNDAPSAKNWTLVHEGGRGVEILVAMSRYLVDNNVSIQDYYMGNATGLYWARTIGEDVSGTFVLSNTVWFEYNTSGVWTASQALYYWNLPGHRTFFPQVKIDTWSFVFNTSRTNWREEFYVDYGNQVTNITVTNGTRGTILVDGDYIVYSGGNIVPGVSRCPYDSFNFSGVPIVICLTDPLPRTLLGMVRLGESLTFDQYIPRTVGLAGLVYPGGYSANTTDPTKYNLNETFTLFDHIYVIRVIQPIQITNTVIQVDEGQGAKTFQLGITDTFDVRAPYIVDIVRPPLYGTMIVVDDTTLVYTPSSGSYFNTIDGENREGFPPLETFSVIVYPSTNPGLYTNATEITIKVNHVPTPPELIVTPTILVKLNTGETYRPVISIVDFDYDLELVTIIIHVTEPATVFIKGSTPRTYNDVVSGTCTDLVEFPYCHTLRFTAYPSAVNNLLRNVTFISMFASRVKMDVTIPDVVTKTIAFKIVDPAIGDTEGSFLLNTELGSLIYGISVICVAGLIATLAWDRIFSEYEKPKQHTH